MQEERLSLEEKKTLLALARHTLEQRLLRGRRETPAPRAHGALLQNRGAFVTLTRRGRLAGCIGTFRSDKPLAEVVEEMAISAALHDPRFPSVRGEDLQSMEIEISALTPLREITDVSDIEVGTHGIYISRGARGGVLLPQVAVEHGWDREQFLAHTCLKAGLPPDAWQEGATIEVFSAEVFSEADPEGSKVSCA
jgi:AmmeMemoRadiSam system protein A